MDIGRPITVQPESTTSRYTQSDYAVPDSHGAGEGHLRKRNCPTLRKILQWHSYVRQGHRCRKIVTIKQMPDNTCSSMRSSLLRRPDRNRDPTLSVTPAYHQNLMFFFRSPCATFPPNFNENRLIFFCVIPLTNKQTSM